MANFYASYPAGSGGGGGGMGTVTSVGLADGSTTPIYTVTGSPVTTAGTLTLTLANQAANTIFAGPTAGGAAEPAFRALVLADLPAGLGTVTTVSVVTANGVSGVVANPTTTPAITLTLGAITPSSVAAVGTVTGSNLSGTNTGDITLAAVGAVPNANAATLVGQVLNLELFDSTHPGVVTASGGGAVNFLRADGTWAAPVGTTISIGALDAQAANANGLALVANVLSSQSADTTHPGMVNNVAQSFSGDKTFTGFVAASTTFNLLDTSAAHFVKLAATSSTPLTADRTLTIDTNNVSSTLKMGANLTVTAVASIAGTNTGDITLTAVGAAPNANGASLSGQVLNLQYFDATHPGVVSASGGSVTDFLRGDNTWGPASASASGGVIVFQQSGGTSVLTDFGNPYVFASAVTISTVQVGMYDSGSSGSTDFTLNQYRAGALIASVTGSQASGGGLVTGSTVALSASLNILSGDVLTADIDAVAGGTPQDFSIVINSGTLAGGVGPIGPSGASAVPVINGTASAPVLITAAGGVPFTGTITDYNNIIYIAGNGGPIVITAIPQIAPPLADGQTLKIISESAVNTVEIQNDPANRVITNGTWVGGLNGVIKFTADSNLNWVEEARQ